MSNASDQQQTQQHEQEPAHESNKARECGCKDRVRDVAIQAMYLMTGAERVHVWQRNEPVGGHIALAERLTQYAQILADHYHEQDSVEFPGVYFYEVAEVMGAWVMHHQSASDAEFRAQLDVIFAEFMA